MSHPYHAPATLTREGGARSWRWALLFALVFPFHAVAQESISIRDAITLAVKQNKALRADSLDQRKAREQSRIVQSVLLPNVSVHGSTLHYFQPPLYFGFGDNGTSNKLPYGRFGGKDQATFSLDVAYNFYSPAARAALSRSHLEEKASSLQYIANTADLVAAVKEVYLRMLVLQKRLQLQEETIERNKRSLEDARSLLAQGKALRVDTLRAYTSWKNLEPDLERLQYAIDVGHQQLNVLLGQSPAANLLLSDTLAYNAALPVPSADEVYAQAMDQRPELKLLDLQREISRVDMKVASGGRLPVVSAVGQYMVHTEANQFKYLEAYWPSTSFVDIQASLPVFSGLANKAKVSRAKVEKMQADIRYEDATDKLHTEAKQVTADLLETKDRIHTQENVVHTAETSYDLTKYRYERGAATRLELTDAELALTTAKSNYLEAVFNYLSARIAMDRLTGAGM